MKKVLCISIFDSIRVLRGCNKELDWAHPEYICDFVIQCGKKLLERKLKGHTGNFRAQVIKSCQNILFLLVLRPWLVHSFAGTIWDTSLITSVTIFCSPAEVVQHDVIVAAAEHPSLHQAKLLPGGQLPLTGEAGEAGQVVHAAPSPPHPVTRVHLPATLGALGAEPTVRKKETSGWRLAAVCRAQLKVETSWLCTESFNVQYLPTKSYLFIFLLHITATQLPDASVTFQMNTVKLIKQLESEQQNI